MILALIFGIMAGGSVMYLMIKESHMRELKEWDRNTKKFNPKIHESFDLREDQLVLTSKRGAEMIFQNIMLFDEPEGVSFWTPEYKVEIKMTRIDSCISLKQKCLEDKE